MGERMSGGVADAGSPRRVLCLHGWRTNPDVMKFQASELARRLPRCSLHFMQARVQQPEACDATIASSFDGPFFAHWNISSTPDAMNEEVAATVRYVAEYVAQHGPFHAVIGFSQVCSARVSALLVSCRRRKLTLVWSGNRAQGLRDCSLRCRAIIPCIPFR